MLAIFSLLHTTHALASFTQRRSTLRPYLHVPSLLVVFVLMRRSHALHARTRLGVSCRGGELRGPRPAADARGARARTRREEEKGPLDEWAEGKKGWA